MTTLASDLKKELMQNPEFKAAYDALAPEFAQIAKEIEARIASEKMQDDRRVQAVG